MQKHTIDGCFLDYGGADSAFHLGGIVKYSTEMYSYVSSFGVVMNPASYAKLPPDLQKLIDDTTRPRIDEVGKLWDLADAPGSKYLIDNGDTPIKLAPGPGCAVQEDRRRGHRQSARKSSTAAACRRPGARRDAGSGRGGRQDFVLVLEYVTAAGCVRCCG